MAATVQTLYYTGATGSPAASADMTGGSVRHKRADNNTVDATNPIPLPASGENFGWRKHSKINVTVTPAGSISNLRWFATVPPAGINLYAWASATYTQGSLATDEAGITGFTDAGNKANNLVTAGQRSSTTPLVLNAGGTILSNPTTGLGTQDYVVTQMGVASTYAGGPGAVTPVTITYRYSET